MSMINKTYIDPSGTATFKPVKFTLIRDTINPSTIVNVDFEISMGSSSSLVAGYDAHTRRVLYVVINGTTYSSDNAHQLLRKNPADGSFWNAKISGVSFENMFNLNGFAYLDKHQWKINETYQYKLSFRVPYISSTASVRLYVIAGDGVSRVPGMWGTGPTGYITDSITPVAATPPGPAQNVTLNGSSNNMIITSEGSQTLTLNWAAPSSDSRTQTIEVRKVVNSSTTMITLSTSATSYSTTINFKDNDVVSLSVRYKNIYEQYGNYVAKTATCDVPPPPPPPPTPEPTPEEPDPPPPPPPEPIIPGCRVYINNTGTHREATFRKVKINDTTWRTITNVKILTSSGWKDVQKRKTE